MPVGVETYLVKLKIHILCRPEIPGSEVHIPEKLIEVHQDICIRMFITLFVFDKIETTQMIINRMGKSVMVYLCDFTAVKMNKLQLHVIT